ncbi:MAG: hypothetical protein FWH37_03705 [Candidatus Bathyarchaeota archaeon]|nr:hypothetical protein [Candidatus Termiticorpusculum sp.]
MILCAGGSREKIELMEMDKDGIMVAEYWTALPPKAEFEQKIRGILIEARQQAEEREALNNSVASFKTASMKELKDN